MRYHSFLRAATITLILMAWTSAALFASPASELAEALARYAEKEAAGKGAQTLSKEVSEAAIAGVAEQVLKDSGEQGLQEVTKLAAKFGPDVIHAVENTPAVAPVLKALETMPEEQLPKAIARLAAGQQGKELAETTVRYGAKALRAEVAHPGVGGRLVRAGRRRICAQQHMYDRRGDCLGPAHGWSLKRACLAAARPSAIDCKGQGPLLRMARPLCRSEPWEVDRLGDIPGRFSSQLRTHFRRR